MTAPTGTTRVLAAPPSAVSLMLKPVLLPGTVAFGSAQSGDGYVFSLTSPSNGAPHLLGRSTVPA